MSRPTDVCAVSNTEHTEETTDRENETQYLAVFRMPSRPSSEAPSSRPRKFTCPLGGASGCNQGVAQEPDRNAKQSGVLQQELSDVTGNCRKSHWGGDSRSCEKET